MLNRPRRLLRLRRNRGAQAPPLESQALLLQVPSGDKSETSRLLGTSPLFASVGYYLTQ